MCPDMNDLTWYNSVLLFFCIKLQRQHLIVASKALGALLFSTRNEGTFPLEKIRVTANERVKAAREKNVK